MLQVLIGRFSLILCYLFIQTHVQDGKLQLRIWPSDVAKGSFIRHGWVVGSWKRKIQFHVNTHRTDQLLSGLPDEFFITKVSNHLSSSSTITSGVNQSKQSPVLVFYYYVWSSPRLSPGSPSFSNLLQGYSISRFRSDCPLCWWYAVVSPNMSRIQIFPLLSTPSWPGCAIVLGHWSERLL